MSGGSGTGAGSLQRVRAAHVAWVTDRLSVRDRIVLETVARLRLVSGPQLEATCFTELAPVSRPVVRGRVLGRLVRWRVLTALPRRIGGPVPGSARALYRLDSVGRALCPSVTAFGGAAGGRFADHTVAVSQVYVDVHAAVRPTTDIQLTTFDAEPASWLPDGVGGQLKPDAHLQLTTSQDVIEWWLEVDRSTESLPTIRRKLLTYLAWVERGGRLSNGAVPRVLFSVPDSARAHGVRQLVQGLPPPAGQLFVVTTSALQPSALLELLLA